jgi:hypothetical protein
MWDMCEGDNTNYTVRPVFARCLILVARVVLREHYNHFLGALILQFPGANSRALAVGNGENGAFSWILPTTSLKEGGVESSWGKKIIGSR